MAFNTDARLCERMLTIIGICNAQAVTSWLSGRVMLSSRSEDGAVWYGSLGADECW
jgi:hypothetical protein